MRKIAFEKRAFENFTAWATTDKRIYQRIVATRCRANWPRRIDEEHRLVYRVDQDAVTIVACKYHY